MKNLVVSTPELIGVFDALERHSFVSVEYQTETKLKKNPFYKTVNKLVKVVLLCGTEYQKAVNNRLKKEGIENPDFVKGETYVERRGNSPVTKKKDSEQMYLSYYELRRDFECFFDSQGNEVSKTLIGEFLPKYQPKSQEQHGLQDGSFVVRKNLKIENIMQVVVDGTTYQHKP
jgi:hypothetical protein